MSYRPHLKEYVMARLVTIAVFIYVFVSIILWLFIEERQSIILSMGLLAMAFMIFIYSVAQSADRMQNELMTVNRYLARIDKLDKIAYKTHFFTQEFEEMNHNLIKILKASKKREDVKQRYNAKLKLKNRQRADMISAIAHEFRNPISSIMGYAQTLEEDKDIPKTLQEKFLGKIYNNGKKIEALLGRLVLWNKFESGKTNLTYSSFDIALLIQETVAFLQEKYVTREISIEASTYIVKADRTLIEIVLKNLIENALKYSKDKVEVQFKEGKVFVIDTGEGISTEEIHKITKKFYRSKVHSWDNSMGLGLAIVKHILTLHEISLEIQSEEKKGSRFSFRI